MTSKKKPKVRIAAMAPSVGKRKGGNVRGAPSGVDWTDKDFGGGKMSDKGKKR